MPRLRVRAERAIGVPTASPHRLEKSVAESRIRVLPSHVIDQIAAGEVVERPASIVKELVENSLDAGARRVDVLVQRGGLVSIRVVDDGCGMSPDEARLALLRHATSKIESAEDLARIATLGFRGEALPSIASVSRLTMVTRTAEVDAGTRLVVEAGEICENGPAGAAPGTQIEVRDLFFNTPARRKFLKSEAAEAAAIGDTMLRLALGSSDVHFRLVQGERVALDLPRHADAGERGRAALPRYSLFRAEASEAGVRVQALLAPPEEFGATSRGLHVLVNGRAVRDRALGHAVTLGFGELCPRGRYPVGVLRVEVAAGDVDVNVHPQKSEVRFARPADVHAAVRHVIARSVADAPWLPSRGQAPRSASVSAAAPERGLYDRMPSVAARPIAAADAPEPPPEPAPAGYFSRLEVIGQLHGTYLVCQAPDELVLIDQHAAHERIAFERLRRALLASRPQVQGLLAPLVLDLGPEEAEVAREHADLIERLGFDLHPFGERSFALRGAPRLLGDADPEPLLRDVLAELGATGQSRAALEREEHVLATMACHSVVRAGDRLDADAMRALLASLDTTDRRANCPHGRPVLLRMPLGEVERRFGRA
jgi:DNA mismatch repair protein MutL